MALTIAAMQVAAHVKKTFKILSALKPQLGVSSLTPAIFDDPMRVNLIQAGQWLVLHRQSESFHKLPF
jgi:hypothetical protein